MEASPHYLLSMEVILRRHCHPSRVILSVFNFFAIENSV
jgi:hypothetical protein